MENMDIKEIGLNKKCVSKNCVNLVKFLENLTTEWVLDIFFFFFCILDYVREWTFVLKVLYPAKFAFLRF